MNGLKRKQRRLSSGSQRARLNQRDLGNANKEAHKAGDASQNKRMKAMLSEGKKEEEKESKNEDIKDMKER